MYYLIPNDTVMEIIEIKKRIEYRTNLKVVRETEHLPVIPMIETKEKKTAGVIDSKKTQIPVDHRGYIKCKKHDFF
ncbi:MAG: hypothetical protein ABWZ25_19595 [Chitinophagaceae bacterium]